MSVRRRGETFAEGIALEPNEALQTIAEVGVALAGFASLVAVFRRRPDEVWAPRALAGLRFMIELSLCAVLFAILPFCLVATGLGEEETWLVSCLALAVAYCVLLHLNVSRSRAIGAQGIAHRQPIQARTGLALGVVIALLLIFSAFNILIPRGPSVFLFALFFLLVGVANQFLNFVATTRPGEERGK
jgi:hypothetical protein